MHLLQFKNTSTPTIVPHIQGRHSYKDSDTYSPIEPIKKRKEAIDGISRLEHESPLHNYAKQKLKMPESYRQKEDDSPSVTDDSSDACNSDDECSTNNLIQPHDKSETEVQKPEADNTKTSTDQRSVKSSIANNMFKHPYVLIIFISVIVGVVLTLKGNETLPQPTVTINTLKESFPQQDEKFWTFIKSGIMEINNFEKPTVIIFMHKKDMTNISGILKNITTYASCIINNNCLIDPIILKGKDLNTPELIEDYGILIDNYRLLLEEKRILVVENIQEVLGSVAQAFHYFCDEYTPLVKRSLIIFTIEVNEYKGKELQQAVNILNRKWKDVDPDKLEPLITRVSSIVLRIK